MGRSRNSLFDEDGPMTRSTADSLFNDDDLSGSGAASPWDLPTPRKPQSRAELIRGLLAGADVPDSYIEAFDHAIQEDGRGGKVSPAGISKTLAAAKLGADEQARIMGILAPGGEETDLTRDAFSVLLALIALAQEGESVSLDSVDERRRSKCCILAQCMNSLPRFFTICPFRVDPPSDRPVIVGWLSCAPSPL
jgi:sorting nexin-8